MDPQQRLLLEVSWAALEARGHRPQATRRHAGGRLRRAHGARLRQGRSDRDRPHPARHLLRDRERRERGLRTAVVFLRPPRTEFHDRHGVLVVARRRPPGVPEPEERANRIALAAGVNVDPRARQHDRGLARAHAVAGRPVQDIRSVRQRIRPQRRLRRDCAQAAVGRRAPTAIECLRSSADRRSARTARAAD